MVFTLSASLAAAVAVIDTAAAGDPISYQELLSIPQPAAVKPIAYGTAPLQFGELRLPETDAVTAPYPVVLLIHGGCWLAEYDMGHVRPLAQALADAGYASWTLEYRRVGDDGGGWPGTFHDVAQGADFLHQLAQQYPLDLSRTVAVGHSAGGQLALWLASRHDYDAEHGFYRADAIELKGIVGLAAAADMDLLAQGRECDDAARRVLDGTPEQVESRYAAVSPVRRVPLGVPQILIDGVEDHMWGPISASYYRSAQAAGDQVQRIVVEETAHFDLVAPQAPVWPHLLAAIETLMHGQHGQETQTKAMLR